MEKIKFPYRSARHLALLNIVAESGGWKKQGLSVEYDFYVEPEEAHVLLKKGKVQFIGGNHITPYIKRATGDDWIYVGQSANYIGMALVVKKDSKIRRLEDLRGKTLAAKGTGGPHTWLNAWLILKKHGLEKSVKIERVFKKGRVWKGVQAGDYDAAIVGRPDDLVARRDGMRTIMLPLLPMIVFTTVSTTGTFVRENGDLVKRFLKGLGHGIRFFKENKKRSKEILNATLPKERGGGDREMIESYYRDLSETLTETLYPTMEAIGNVYAEACRYNAAARKVNPLELWDLHFLRQLRDAGEL
ncbi:MAG TPA: ABC transporter substrate-binding protein [Candidatus Eisenbacteria bacterium]|nr:ABC transporter substrate-binding protein [Candidatus Eisenbacteria bacterium]